jgi:copper transport protein
MKRLLLMLAVLFGGALLVAAPASGHATVTSSNPSDGERLQRMPVTVMITFDEQVGLGSLGYLHVTDEQGKRVEAGGAYHPAGNARAIEVALQRHLPGGTYIESYRVISADSHPIAGVVRFVVGNGPLLTDLVPGGSGTVNHLTSVALDASRWISWSGLALFGGSWLLLTVWPAGRDDRRAQRIVWTGWVGAVVGAVLEVLVQGPYTAGAGLAKIGNWSILDNTLHSKYGEWHSARLLILGVLALLLARTLQPHRDRYLEAATPLALALAFTYAATGHAQTTNPTWLSLLADTLHLAAMATWVGGLVILLAAVLPRRDPDELDAVLPVFSRTAFGAVAVLAVTGTYAAWRGVGSWRAFFHTEYGLLVLAKVVLFVGVLALGNLSRRVVQGRMVVAFAMSDEVAEAEAEAEPAAPAFDARTERLRRSVLVEVAVAVLVLAATAVLVGQPRGAEALAAQDRAAVTRSAALGGGRSVSVTVEPGVHGPIDIEVTLSGGAAKSVTATASEPDRQLGPIPLGLTHATGGVYSAQNVVFPVAGDWVINLLVTSSTFDAVTADVPITLH